MSGLLHHMSKVQWNGDGQESRRGNHNFLYVGFWVTYQMSLTGTAASAKHGEKMWGQKKKQNKTLQCQKDSFNQQLQQTIWQDTPSTLSDEHKYSLINSTIYSIHLSITFSYSPFIQFSTPAYTFWIKGSWLAFIYLSVAELFRHSAISFSYFTIYQLGYFKLTISTLYPLLSQLLCLLEKQFHVLSTRGSC